MPRATGPRAGAQGRIAIVVCVLAVLAVTLAIPVREWLSQRAEISRLQSDVAAAQARVAELEQQALDWDDPAYIEAQARTRLHFVYPGEVGYVVLGADDRPVSTDPPPPNESEPWYAVLWDSTRAADRVDPVVVP